MAVALVANVGKGGGASASAAIDTTGADYIVIAQTSFGVGAGTPSDNKSNVWTMRGLLSNGSFSLSIWTTIVAPTVGTGHTFTPGGSFPSIAVAAFSGVRRNVSGATVTGTSLAPGTLDLDASPGLAVTGLGWNSDETVSIGSGFTITDQVNWSSGSHLGVALAYLITTSTTAGPTWSWTDSQDMISMMTLVNGDPVGGGGGGGGSFTFVG